VSWIFIFLIKEYVCAPQKKLLKALECSNLLQVPVSYVRWQSFSKRHKVFLLLFQVFWLSH